MATVPVYDLPTQEPNVGNMPAFQAPSVEPMRNFAGKQIQEAGQAVQNFGTTVTKIATRLQNEVDDANSKLLYNDFASEVDNIETQYLTTKNKDAVDKAMPTRDAILKAFQKAVERAENDTQRTLLHNAASVRLRSADSSIIRHSITEQRQFDIKETGAQVDTLVNDASRYSAGWRQPDGDFQIYYNAAKKRAGELADKLGYVDTVDAQGRTVPSAQRQELLLKVTNAIHTNAMSAAIDGQNFTAAADYLQRYGNEMTPEAFQKVKKALDMGKDDVEEQRIADNIWSASNGDIGAALTLARSSLTGKQEDAVVNRLKVFDNEKNTIVQRSQAQAKDNAWRIYAETGSMQKIPPTVLAGMDGADLASLKRTAAADLEARLKGKEVKTDSNVYYQLTQEAMTNPNFSDPAKFDLRKYFDKLSPGDRNHFINLQRTMSNKMEAPEAVTTQQQISATIKQLGLKDEKAGMFTEQANRALFAAQTQKGGKLDQGERQKIIDGLVLQGEILTGSWYRPDPNVFRFEARARGEEAKFAPAFTDSQKNRAREALVRAGVANPTKQQIEAVLYETYGLTPRTQDTNK